MTTQAKSKPHLFRASRVLAILVTLALLVLSLSPPNQGYAFNGYLEDCDFDGFDDETHAPVPWYGFDETKGDVVPSDWDGKAGSYVFTTPTTPTVNSGSTTTDSASTANSGNTTTTSTPTATSQTPTQNTATPASTAAPATDSAEGTNAEAAENTDAVAAEDSAGAGVADSSTPLTSISPVAAAIVAVKGTLDVAPKSGASYRAGAEIVIKGASFAGNIKELQLIVSSTNPQTLARVATSLDGTFEATVNLPSNLEPGKHDIIVFYEESPIVKRTIDVVEATPEFATTDDKVFIGILLLATLAIIGVGALLGWRATKKKRLEARASQ